MSGRRPKELCMQNYKILQARNCSTHIVVLVSFTDNSYPARVTDRITGFEYPILSVVEMLGLLTIRNPMDGELFSVFYREAGIPL